MKCTVSTSRWKARALVATCALVCAAPIAAAGDFTPGVTDFPSRLTGSETSTERFVPGVTDFPSYVADDRVAERFVAGVTDVPNAFASAGSTPSKQIVSNEYGMPRAMPSDYAAAGVELPTPRVPATMTPAVDRFDWRDAGVGAAIAAGALALAAGAALIGRNRALLARGGA